ncbi:MAG TPA: sugar phosphate nucleotidyltransferase [Candidatus Woesearchaeota archaeon]|nr:sugar phosphate nucleotidyltransferase [Candidatus Woesearchaeota archaeon]
MKALLLAAGEGRRTRPLTNTTPKPLLRVANKPIIEYNIDAIWDMCEEIYVVVGYLKEKIIKYLDTRYNKTGKEKIKFIIQDQPLGTGNAVLIAKNLIGEDIKRFLVINGDDIYCKEDLLEISRMEYAILSKEVLNPEFFGILKIDKFLRIQEIIEKPKDFVSNLASLGCYILPTKIFEALKSSSKSLRGEIELPSAINSIAKEFDIKAVKSKGYWLPIGYPWTLLDANEEILKKTKGLIKGKVFEGASIEGSVVIGEDTIILPGSRIEGPVIIGKNCKIGPNCYIRAYSSIGDNCHIGNGTEVKNSIIMNNSNAPHLNYVGDSIIGENCNLGAGTIIANLRHDGKTIKSEYDGVLIDSNRRKLGTIIGDQVKTAINTSIYPGRKIYPLKSTSPGEKVEKDIK